MCRTKTRLSWAMLEYTMEASLDGLSQVGSLQRAKLEPGLVELGVGAKRYSVVTSESVAVVCCQSRHGGIMMLLM